MVQSSGSQTLIIEENTDPRQIARYRAQDERHARNLAWLESHWNELTDVLGRFVAVADRQAFIADTGEAAWNWARLEHPDDDGAVVMFVPAKPGWRIYANRG